MYLMGTARMTCNWCEILEILGYFVISFSCLKLKQGGKVALCWLGHGVVRFALPVFIWVSFSVKFYFCLMIVIKYSGGVSLYAWCRYSWVFMLLMCGAEQQPRQMWSDTSHGVTRSELSKNWLYSQMDRLIYTWTDRTLTTVVTVWEYTGGYDPYLIPLKSLWSRVQSH